MTDAVFLLSRVEVQKYFPSEVERVAKYKNEGPSGWWLRLASEVGTDAWGVGIQGAFNFEDRGWTKEYYAVRPALWVNLD